MKIYEFKKKSLDDIPTINDDEKFELKLENNNISNFNTEKISINCRKLHLQNNKLQFYLIFNFLCINIF